MLKVSFPKPLLAYSGLSGRFRLILASPDRCWLILAFSGLLELLLAHSALGGLNRHYPQASAEICTLLWAWNLNLDLADPGCLQSSLAPSVSWDLDPNLDLAGPGCLKAHKLGCAPEVGPGRR